MKKKSLPITNIGTVSLMMIFIILCMVIFAALSLSGAFRDSHMGEKRAEHLTDYYTASNEAEELLSTVDDAFAYAYENAADEAEYYRLIDKKLRSDDFEKIWNGETLDIAFQTNIGTSQTLQVLIDVLSPQQIVSEKGTSFYRILSWQTVPTDSWEGDSTLHLIQ